ncbi:MAG: transposase [Rhodoferax sp.]|nr:transposase [Rhodoferax sp.]
MSLNVIEAIVSASAGRQRTLLRRLLTTHAVTNLEDARQCITWYCMRWTIEQTFRTIKSKGLNLESSLIEEASRLVVIVMAHVGCSASHATDAGAKGKTLRPATDVFYGSRNRGSPSCQPTLEEKQRSKRIPMR